LFRTIKPEEKPEEMLLGTQFKFHCFFARFNEVAQISMADLWRLLLSVHESQTHPLGNWNRSH